MGGEIVVEDLKIGPKVIEYLVEQEFKSKSLILWGRFY